MKKILYISSTGLISKHDSTCRIIHVADEYLSEEGKTKKRKMQLATETRPLEIGTYKDNKLLYIIYNISGSKKRPEGVGESEFYDPKYFYWNTFKYIFNLETGEMFLLVNNKFRKIKDKTNVIARLLENYTSWLYANLEEKEQNEQIFHKFIDVFAKDFKDFALRLDEKIDFFTLFRTISFSCAKNILENVAYFKENKIPKFVKKWILKEEKENDDTLLSIVNEKINFYRFLKDEIGISDINLINNLIKENIRYNRILNANAIKKIISFKKKYNIPNAEMSVLNYLYKNDKNYEVPDTLKMVNSLLYSKKRKYIKDIDIQAIIAKTKITNLHDVLIPLERKMIALSHNEDFEYSDELKEFDNYSENGITYHLPKNSLELTELGQAMKNCVAGYWHKVKYHNSVIIYGSKNDIPFVCIELNGELTRIRQCYGYNNNRLNNEDNQKVHSFLDKILVPQVEKTNMSIDYDDLPF